MERKWRGKQTHHKRNIIVRYLQILSDPCIRGHRSSKCDHAKERMLMEVRKPGRPLSQCPHTTHLCDCPRSVTGQSRVQVALNRKSAKKCPCGSDTPHPSSVPTPPSPTKHTFKVDKTITSSRQPTRKQPDLESYVDRIDQSHINVIMPHQCRPIQPNVPLMVNGGQVLMAGPLYNGFAQSEFQLQESRVETWQNGNGFSNSNGNGMHKPPTHVKMDSGVGGFTMPMELPSKSTHSSVGSCCGSPSTPISNDLNAVTYFQTPYHQIQPVQPLIAPYGYPSPFSTQGHATPDPQWQQPSVFTQTSAPFSASIPAPFQTLPKAENGHVAADDDTHNCSCGDGCNCLACIVHPHNSRTTALVQSAMMKYWGEGIPMSTGYDPTMTSVSSPENGEDMILNASDYQFEEYLFPCDGDKSSCRCPDGCQCSGCQLHEQGFCWGDSGECPCGPECECIGCTVHGNSKVGVNLEKELKEAVRSCCAPVPEPEEVVPKKSCCS
jgi:hypothetical protein